MHPKLTIQGVEYGLEDLEEHIWHQLDQAIYQKNDPFRVPALASSAPNGIGLRSIVLRELLSTEHILLFHSDRRASKIAEIQADNRVSLLFYHPEKQIQIRMQGLGTIHENNDIAQKQWEKTSVGSLKVYLTKYAPGESVAEPISGIPSQFETKKLQREEIEPGRKNFAVIMFKAQFIDWLWIDQKGHKRAQFTYIGKTVNRTWVIP